MASIDGRKVRVSFEIDGKLRSYEGLNIHASGTKFANPNSDECVIKIANLKREVLDYLATETSPFNANKKPKTVIIEAGRESYGYSEIYRGNIQTVSISQPPDVMLEVHALTGIFQATQTTSKTAPAKTTIQALAQGVASDLGASLTFEAQNKSIANFIFAGGTLEQIKALADLGIIDAYLDGRTLVVKDKHIPLNGKVRVLRKDTGMIGVPQFTEFGIKATFLLDNQTVIGGALDIKSEINPAIDGKYAIYKLEFEIATHETPFYYTAYGVRIKDA